MKHHCVLAVTTLLLAAAAIACGSSSSPSVTTTGAPTIATAVSPPEASPAAILTPAPLPQTTGWLVYLRGGNLYLGDLRDGSEQQLTSGSVGAGYAGYTGYQANVTVYYAELIEPAPANGRSLGTARVSRRRIDTGVADDLFTFQPVASSTDGKPLAHAVSVAPDGNAIAYADDAGVQRYNIATGTTITLLASDCQTEPRPQKGCVSYINPRWSPDGKWILAAKLGYEGSISVVVRADGPTSVREFPDVGGDVQSWSPDSRYFCAFNEIYAPGGGHLVSPADGSRHPLDGRFSTAKDIAACTWDAFGKLAVMTRTDAGGDGDVVSTFQIQPPTYQATVNPVPLPYRDVVGWLPDGSGLIVQGSPPCAPCGERPPLVAALMISDGSLRVLPFAAFTSFGDGVVGSIPFAPPKDD